MTTGCPPIGLCMDDNGNAFVGSPTGSPALTALQAVMKTGIMASIAIFAGPLIAVHNIAVSQFLILSRLEMVSRKCMKQRYSTSSTVALFSSPYCKNPCICWHKGASSSRSVCTMLFQALGNTFKQLISRMAKSKAITNIKELFSTPQDRKKLRESAAQTTASLGDEVEQSLTAFFQGHERQRCQR